MLNRLRAWWLGLGWPGWLFFAVLVLHLFLNFYGLIAYNYQIGPGGDMRAHIGIIYDLLQNGGNNAGGYPSGFHWLIVWLHQLTGASPLKLTAVMASVLPVVSALALWLSARLLFNRQVAAVTYLLYALVSLQPLQTLYDGGFPTILGGHTILPLLITAYLLLWRRFSWVVLGAFLVLAWALTATHHLSTLVAVVVLAFGSLPLVVQQLERRWQRLWLSLPMGIIIWLVVLAAGYAAFLNLGIFASARGLAELFLSFSAHFPFIEIKHVTVSEPWVLFQYSSSINGLIFQSALFGSFVPLWWAWKKRDSQVGVTLLVLMLWFWLLFEGSQRAWLGEPGRLARDISLPGSILAGVFVCWLLNVVRPNKLLLWATGSVIGWLVLYGAIDKADILLVSNPRVYVTGADKELVAVINNDARPALMWEQSGVWRQFGAELLSSGKLAVTDVPSEGVGWLKQPGHCFYTSVFRQGVWPAEFADDSLLEQAAALGRKELLVVDGQKVWYRVCSKP